MTDLKLPKLPERTPIKLAVVLSPGLAADLALYANLYERKYGCNETVSDLVPAMLAAFMESDRQFLRIKRERGRGA